MMHRWFVVLACLAFVACGSPTAPKGASGGKGKPAATKDKKKEEPTEETAAQEEEYVYSPVGKRDPFRSYLDRIQPATTLAPDPLCGPLCNWDLEQLRLVAVISGMANPIAMVEDPQGNGHTVRRGTSIGKRNGKVTEILRDRIIVTEYRRLGTGEVVAAETEVELRGSGRSAAEKEPVNLMAPEDGLMVTEDGVPSLE